ncbi:MAG TPA: diacylglycerol kinase family protein [Streptosporangiaceae bacterium]|nr:diacylglycerol kinase family protein [Streptosporangiaceae bacterium]
MTIVVNRIRVRDPGRFRRRCTQAAQASGREPWFAETSEDDAGVALAADAVAAGARLVVAAGGDGTVRACAQALACTGVPLAIVPRGAGNLTARALGVPSQLGAALATAFSGRDRRVDLAVADGMSFAAMAGMGLDAAVVGGTPGLLKRRLGWLAYAAAGVARLPGRPHEFTVRLDGGPPLSRRARSVVVGNVGLLPGGFALLPDARLDDGLLDVGILAPSHALGWGLVAQRVLTRSRRDDLNLERYQARRIEIRAGADLPREVDGEVIAPGRSLTITVRPGALLVRVPAR